MNLSPRYGGDPVIEMDGEVTDQRGVIAAQRSRMETALGSLTDEQWRAPSRCAGWSVQDVVEHLIGVNGFWTMSIGAGVAGEPTRILAGFDPKATPAAMVAGAAVEPPATTLARFGDSNAVLVAALDALDASGWSAPAETPPGHLPVRLLAMHALWDAWVHERDMLVPLGIEPVAPDDEVASSLRYVAALGPAFAIGTGGRGTLLVEVTDPHVRVVVDVGDAVRVHGGDAPADALVLSGRAVDVLDALSIRAPLGHDVPPDQRWLVTGLADVFEEAIA